MTDNIQKFDSAGFLAVLQQDGLLSEAAVLRVALAARETTTSVERVILELGLLAEETVFQSLAAFMHMPYVTSEDVDAVAMRSSNLPNDFMKRVLAIPSAQDDTGYIIATATPDMADTLASISYMLGVSVTGAIASPTTITTALDLSDDKDQDKADTATSTDVERLQALANDGPVISLVNDIIGKAVGLSASDVHIETQERGARVRYRVDGALMFDRTIPDAMRSSVTSRLKIMANLNITERRRPQDGRADIVVRGRSIDIRMSTLPTQHGESIVLRLLDRNRMQLDWQSLKFPADRIAQIENLMACPNGIFLVAGPTGSGKTTTLYTALRGINSEDRKIITVEDPIEYSLEGVNQVQVDPAIDMSFATALRAILRQDPNVVMVGEVRDEETAEIAVRAALIGRLVLSTIHTNDAVSAIDRLLDLGVAPYLIGATLRGVLSQRLVRTQCDTCQGNGCDACRNTGKRGRMAISEILVITSEIAEAITLGRRSVELQKVAQASGFVAIKEQAEALVRANIVANEEAYRALGFD